MLVSRRYERASLIVTSNKPFCGLGRDLRRRRHRRRDDRPARPPRRDPRPQRRQLPPQRPRPRPPRHPPPTDARGERRSGSPYGLASAPPAANPTRWPTFRPALPAHISTGLDSVKNSRSGLDLTGGGSARTISRSGAGREDGRQLRDELVGSWPGTRRPSSSASALIGKTFQASPARTIVGAAVLRKSGSRLLGLLARSFNTHRSVEDARALARLRLRARRGLWAMARTMSRTGALTCARWGAGGHGVGSGRVPATATVHPAALSSAAEGSLTTDG